jgi:signal transduction histidine kinase
MSANIAARILDELPVGVAAFGADCRLIMVNDAFVRLTGIDARSATGLGETAFSDLLAGRCKSGCYFEGIAALRRRHAQGPGARAAALLEMPGSPRATLEVEFAECCSGDLSFQLIFRNVTAETGRSTELSLALDKAAHQIRIPMANVYGYAELLMRGGFDAAALAEIHGVIFRNADQMRVLVADVFEFARLLSEPDGRARHRPVHLQTLLTGCIARHRPPAGREPPSIELAPTELLARGDPLQLDQAVAQVIANAYRFSDVESTVSVRLYWQARAGGGSEAVLAVCDRGIGMDEATRLRAGEPFFRADTSGQVPGNGLGLCIAGAIMAAHQGRLEIKSGPGAGTEVRLILPSLEPCAAAV